jgi:hypothetical protein
MRRITINRAYHPIALSREEGNTVAEWLIRVIGKQRQEIDKDLLVQAILALGRQLSEQQASREQSQVDVASTEQSEPAA